MRRKPRKHMYIPDTQVKPGVPIEHVLAAGNYALAKRPDVIVVAGDWWDMHSLSSYDKGTKNAEGANYQADIDAGIEAMELFLSPITRFNARKTKIKREKYKPRLVFTLGNHEERIMRHVNANPEMHGKLGYHDFGLEAMGFEVHDFLKPVEIDGLTYAHYFYNPNTGRPYGGKTATKLNNIGFSFVMGHQQGLDPAIKHLNNGKTLRGLTAGSFYQHEEKYKGYQGNDHWQGCLMLHEVKDGDYCLMELSIEFLMENWL